MKRQKNKEETMRLLINTVGEILREEGHAGLGVNRISLRSGVAKPLIYRYFFSLNSLLRSYIEEKDYWLSMFVKLKEHSNAEPENLQEFFTTVLQQQFLYFQKEKEMQKFILWQISKEHPLMRSVSEKREKEGASLLALSDPHFQDSGINFRALYAIVVGGIYYLVMHANNNKSTVCGIDINWERDRLEVLRTIEQIITWAWKAAA